MYLCYDTMSGGSLVQTVCALMENWNLPVMNMSCREYEERIAESNSYDMQKCIENEKYVIIILNQQLIRKLIALVELEITRKLFARKNVRVFVFMDGIKVNELPGRIQWMNNADITVVENIIDIHKGIFKIITTFLRDTYIHLPVLNDICMSSDSVLNDFFLLKYFNIKNCIKGCDLLTQQNKENIFNDRGWMSFCKIEDEFIKQLQLDYADIDDCFSKVIMCHLMSNHIKLHIYDNYIITFMSGYIRKLYEYSDYSSNYEKEVLCIAETAIRIILAEIPSGI